MNKLNLLENLPTDKSKEHFYDIVKSDAIRIERIVSYGQSSPQTGWYQQDEDEWVCVLTGYGVIGFEKSEPIRLEAGDTLLIPAGIKHRVLETDKETQTVWLAVFYKN